MIVEDEKLILEGIVKLIDWNFLDLELVHKAHDGREALSFWNQNSVDIIITDINMPEMSGLELISEIRKTDVEVSFIILSGYDEFEYARKAVTLDVEEYILKPIDENVLQEALIHTTEKIKFRVAKKENNIMEYFRVKNLVHGEIDNLSEFFDEYSFQKFEKGYCLANLKIRNSFKTESEMNRFKEYLIGMGIQDCIKIFVLDQNEFIIIISSTTTASTKHIEFFRKLQIQIEQDFNQSCFIAVGSLQSSLLNLNEAFKEIQKIKKYFLVYGFGECISSNTVLYIENARFEFHEEEIYQMIVTKEKEKLINYLDQIFISILKGSNPRIESLYTTLVKIILLLNKIEQEFGIKRHNNLEISDLFELLHETDEIRKIKNEILLQALEIIDMLELEKSQVSPVIRQIIQIVNNHYQNNMSLKTLAYKYKMNPSYLGQIFQKEVGKSFSQFLNETRNRKAKELILSTNMRMQEIAFSVGYVEISYFYRMFRKQYGVSPASLREMKGVDIDFEGKRGDSI